MSIFVLAASGTGGLLHDPTFWVALAFVLFVVLVAKKIYSAATSGLDTYANEIEDKLNEARELREESQNLLAEYKRKQASAMDDVEAILAQARSSAEAMKATAEDSLNASMQRREEAALMRIKQAEVQAAQEVRHQTVDIAVAAMEKILADKASGKLGTGLVDEAIKQLPTSIH
jgi:F-type H+-transporting ATPase subunit b